ncbi:hypothetical protein [Alloyangia pacifica]|uniref:hypothetical protein n=1 Tax=Alloyangia pacifica TaxID=311180 RepID=UPI001CD45225|nr:hypothetical protein [Alloyangia pacifica]MCA0994798.1 hypothetical protein [Alloyangia pacifica]
MDLSVATHFGHGGTYGARKADALLAMIKDSGATGIRDSISWARVESSPGVYDFSSFRESFPNLLEDNGLGVTLTLSPHGNPLYDDGETVTSAEGIAAFANFVSALLDEFPSVERVVIGNEFNGLNDSFVSGTAASMSVPKRAEYYTDILEGVYEAVSDSHADVQIGGGALHSVATGYVEALIDAGAFAYMDTLDLHPYGQDPVEVGTSLAHLNTLLDALPEDQRPDIVVTEFGTSADSDDPLSNAAYLAKMVAVMAANGVSEAAWYALLDEDLSNTPDMGLYDSIAEANDMLSGFRFVAALLEGDGAVQKLEVGAGIEAYSFNDGTIIAWGSFQDVSISGTGLVFRDAGGSVIDAPTSLDDDPIYIQGTDIEVSTPQAEGVLLADSFYDWDLSGDPEGPWSYHMLKIQNGVERESILNVMEGQSRMGEQWNPYLGDGWARPFFMTADTLLPVAFATDGSNDRAALERYTSEADGPVDIVASWSVSSASEDGVIVELRLNGETLTTLPVTETSALVLRALEVQSGDQLDFIVHDGATSSGDATTRHIRILTADSSKSTETLLQEHIANDQIEGDVDAGSTQVIDLRAEAPDAGGSEGDITESSDIEDADFSEVPRQREGTDGDDLLVDFDGSDARLTGLAGDDTLFGLDGDDILKGGAGADVFVFTKDGGRDTVRDFNADEGDVLDLTPLDLEASEFRLTESDWGLHIEILTDDSASEIALVKRTMIADLDDGSLIF